jgi:hypothetical protein
LMTWVTAVETLAPGGVLVLVAGAGGTESVELVLANGSAEAPEKDANAIASARQQENRVFISLNISFPPCF